MGFMELIDPDFLWPNWIFTTVTFVFLISGYLLTRYTAVAEIQMIIDNDGVKKKWIKQFLFQKKPNIKIGWEEIVEFNFEPDRQFDKFFIVIKSGAEFKLTHNSDDKDDFEKFIKDFQSSVNKFNIASGNSTSITKGENIYEGKTGLVLAGFGAVILVVLLSSLIFNTTKPSNFGGIGIACLAISYFIYQVYLHRKK